MEKFTESEKCVSRKYCFPCLVSEGWRKIMMKNYEWDGKCPFGVVIEDLPNNRLNEPKSTIASDKPCPSKVCRMGDMMCDDYRSCRDTCLIEKKRITSMETCPKLI